MKVVYKESAYDRLLKKIYEARRNNKLIDYVLVSYEEWDEIRSLFITSYAFDYAVNPHQLAGARLETVELRNPAHRYPGEPEYIRAIKQYKIEDVFVIPVPESYAQ